MLAAFRVVQGIGAAGSAGLVLATVRDVAEGKALVLLLSRVTLVTTTAPLLAPVWADRGFRRATLVASATYAGVYAYVAASPLLPQQVCTGTSVHGFACFTVAGLVSPVAGLVGITDATPVALVLLATSLTALLGAGLLLRSTREQPGRTEALTAGT